MKTIVLAIVFCCVYETFALDAKTEKCSAKADPGPCKAAVPAWHFDRITRTCQSFSYGGCAGNGNRFGSKQACEDACRDVPPCPTPMLLPLRPGCRYDDEQGDDGCWMPLLVCEETPEDQLKTCSASLDAGVFCKGVRAFVRPQRRWRYDRVFGRCVSFNFRGCEGNDNRFQSRESCETACGGVPPCPTPRLSPPKPGCRYVSEQGTDGCFMPMMKCPSKDAIAACSFVPTIAKCSKELESKWQYDRIGSVCREVAAPFCGGMEKAFNSEEECEKTCTGVPRCPVPMFPFRPRPGCKMESVLRPDGCTMPRLACKSPRPPKRCPLIKPAPPKPGCRIVFKVSKDRCPTPTEICEDATKRCSHKPQTGRCRASIKSWAFDRVRGRCTQFTYGGCGGNANRFNSESECMDVCKDVPRCPVARMRPPRPGCKYVNKQERNGCFMPKEVCPPVVDAVKRCSPKPETGRCKAAIKSWAFDRVRGRCTQFTYGGCGGNANRFKSESECMGVCRDVPRCPVARMLPPRPGCKHVSKQRSNGCYMPEEVCPPEVDAVKKCSPKPETGRCKAAIKSWAFDRLRGRCVEFTYGGCGGNENRFKSEAECMGVCKDVPRCALPGLLPPGPGCKYVEKQQSNGCFMPEEECERSGPRDGKARQQTCSQKRETGMCMAAFRKWGFDRVRGRCVEFTYGGCGGNSNRFDSQAECSKFCAGIPPCALPSLPPPPEGCKYVDVLQTDGCPMPKLQCALRVPDVN